MALRSRGSLGGRRGCPHRTWVAEPQVLRELKPQSALLTRRVTFGSQSVTLESHQHPCRRSPHMRAPRSVRRGLGQLGSPQAPIVSQGEGRVCGSSSHLADPGKPRQQRGLRAWLSQGAPQSRSGTFWVVCLSPGPPVCRVTESILAMARPSTELLEKYGVIEQFRR